MTNFWEEHNNKVVSVQYGDGKGNHEITVEEVFEKWNSREESEQWVKNFMNSLILNGVAHSRFAKYTLLK